MSTCVSLGQPYKSRCANLGQAVVGDMTALLMFTDPLSSCNNDNSNSKHDDHNNDESKSEDNDNSNDDDDDDNDNNNGNVYND